jgi:hypothetical protein
MNAFMTRTLATALCLLANGVASASPPVISSTFDADADGWLTVDFPGSHVANPSTKALPFDGANGNPAGSVRIDDQYAETGVAAPAKFLGDASAYYGGTLEYDILIRTTDGVIYWEAVLNGGTQSLFYTSSGAPPALGVFEHRTVPLTETGWHRGSYNGPAATQAEMLQVLGTLTGLYIRTEWKTGPDDTSVDNVRLQNGVGGSIVQFDAALFPKAENVASHKAVIRATRGGDLAGAAQVDFGTADGTATDGLDYSAASGTLNWADGEGGIKTFNVTLLDDALDEANETVKLSLSNAVGATLGAQDQATLRITDDDDAPTVAFDAAAQSVNEGTGTAKTVKLSVSLSAASGKRITVPFSVAYGTASPDDLQSIGASPLVFAAGTTSKTIRVVTNPDADVEGNEKLTFTLGAPVNASLGGITDEVLTIKNDD